MELVELFLLDGEEGIDAVGVELGAAIFFDLFAGHVRGERLAVGAIRSHGVIGVDYGEDSRADIDVRSVDGIGVALAVVTLVVATDQQPRVAKKPDAFRDVVPVDGVAPHLGPLILGELAWFEQDGVADADLADVVEESTPLDVELLDHLQIELLRETTGVESDATGMPLRLRVP